MSQDTDHFEQPGGEPERESKLGGVMPLLNLSVLIN